MTKNTVIKTFIDVPVLLQTTLTFAMDILGGIKVPHCCDMPREKLDCWDGMILKMAEFATPWRRLENMWLDKIILQLSLDQSKMQRQDNVIILGSKTLNE